MNLKRIVLLSILLLTLTYTDWPIICVGGFSIYLWLVWRHRSLPKNGVDVIGHPLLFESASSLARKIKNREILSETLVEIFIQQIQRVNPDINAMVATRFEIAREEAREADRKTKTTPPGELPPFHGVPCSIKECFALTGMPNTSGLLLRKGVISHHDATTVARLRAAGAIPLGVTNISELCMWMESSNLIYGRTNNPYNINCIVGGSSGGEASLLSACGTPFGLGSDIGGSIRLPAYFCGIFGHKPSGGLVPGTGQFPLAKNEALRILTTGPLCKQAEDLMPLLRILASPDGIDEKCIRYELGDPKTVKIENLKFYSVHTGPTGLLYSKVSEDITESQIKVELHLKKLGAVVERVHKMPEFEETLFMWSSCLSYAGNDDFAYMMGNLNHSINSFWELGKWILDSPSHTLPAIGLSLIEKIPKLFPERTKRFTEKAALVKKQLEEKLGPQGVILYPTYPKAAPTHHGPILSPFDFVYTAIFNIVQFPVTQVPLGLNNHGLPLGIQVASIPGNDAITIAVALELEKAFGGWTPPTRKYNLQKK